MSFLAFGASQDGFQAIIHRNSFLHFSSLYGAELERLEGLFVEVSGTLSMYQDRPQMALNRPEQIRITDAFALIASTLASRKLPIINASDRRTLNAHVGEAVTIEGRVLLVSRAPRSPMLLINLTTDEREQQTTGVLRDRNLPLFVAALGDPAEVLPGKKVRMSGTLYPHNRNFNLELRDPAQLQLME